MKFPFFFKSSSETTVASWPWQACAADSGTLSFRAGDDGALPATLDSVSDAEVVKNDDTGFSDEFQGGEIFSPDSEIPVEGLRSERFFFEPENSNSILEEARMTRRPAQRSCAAVFAEMDSSDPVLDFRVSMEEMVEAHGLAGDWDNLENLLACYLRVNSKSNHGYVIGAFIDLIFRLDLGSDFADESSSAVDGNCSSSLTTAETQCSFTCPLSFSSPAYSPASACNVSSAISSLENGDGKNGGCNHPWFSGDETDREITKVKKGKGNIKSIVY